VTGHLTLSFTTDSFPRLLSISYSIDCPSFSVLRARLLNGGYVHEHILAGACRLDEPIALCRIEPLQGACSHSSLRCWPEPFGLVMIEAMACGTPVLAFRQGSVAEIIDQGVTGAIIDTMDEAMMILPRVIALDHRAVRRRFEQRFSSARMATTVPMPRPILEKRLNGQGLNGDRAHRAAETDALL
jgi:hypothetical protein